MQKHQLGEVWNKITPSSCISSGIFLPKIIKIEQATADERRGCFFDSRCRDHTLSLQVVDVCSSWSIVLSVCRFVGHVNVERSSTAKVVEPIFAWRRTVWTDKAEVILNAKCVYILHYYLPLLVNKDSQCGRRRHVDLNTDFATIFFIDAYDGSDLLNTQWLLFNDFFLISTTQKDAKRTTSSLLWLIPTFMTNICACLALLGFCLTIWTYTFLFIFKEL